MASFPSRPSATRYVTFISIVAALGGLLFGYDTAVISGAIGFLRTYFDLSAAEMGWAAASALLGCVLGASGAGVASDRFGRKKILMVAGVFFAVSAVWTALPGNFTQFVIARILGGIGVGIASMLSPMYIAEVAPAQIRGRLVTFNQFAIVTGILTVYFVNYSIAGLGVGDWNVQVGWRWMFGSEAFPAILFLFFLFLIPESPRWLIKEGREEEARKVLSRVRNGDDIEDEVREIKKTLTVAKVSMRELLHPTWRGVVVLGAVLAILQQVTGINVFMYYAPEIFKQLGAGVDSALLQTIVVGAVNMLFTVVALYTIDRVGRKTLLIAGASGMGLSLTALGWAAATNTTEIWVLAFVLGYIACFAASMGPVVWVVLSEIFPTRLRGRAMAVATFSIWLANYAVSQTFPILNENEWLVATFGGGFPFWLYAFFCVVTVVVSMRYIPETKGKTLEQIEEMWKSKTTN
ncbi:MAG: sugar porter family MFS transporter [Bacteroidota bacterium]